MAKISMVEKIDGVQVPFNVFVERRKTIRVSFGRSGVNVRMPSAISTARRQQHYDDALQWATLQIEKTPQLLDAYKSEPYSPSSILNIYDETIHVEISESDRATGTGKYDARSNTIKLILPNDLKTGSKTKMTKQLLSRVCAQKYLPAITKRVHEINNNHFHKEIKSVKLKYNKSNWGSCSTAKNVNLSTRLLFAPKDVIDYVIVHELSHLYEMNHSAKFWNIVSQVMPDYKTKEAWLEKHGRICDF